VLLVGVLGLVIPAMGASAQTVQELEAKLQALAQEIDALKTKVEEPEFKVSTKGGIRVESSDGNFKGELGGRMQLDAAFYSEDKTRLGDGTQFRRLRLHANGTLYRDWGYRVEIDFANNQTAIRDGYITYAGLDPVALTVGHFKEPFSLEELTSDNYITFMERSLVNALVPSRRIGAMGDVHDENWTFAAGAFSGDADDDPAGEGDEGWSLTGRGTVAPILEETMLAHAGLGVRYKDPNSETVSFSAKPESNVTGTRFVNTGNIAKVNSQVAVNPELAFVYGPFSAQGEYVWLNVDRDVSAGSSASDSINFDAWYVLASYLLTGESRPYDAAKGIFGRVKPSHNLGPDGIGAVELAVRYSNIDLTDDTINGGGEKNLGVEVNWYMNPYVRLSFNYIHVDNDNKALGASAADLLPGESFEGDDDPDIFQARAQIDF
jgi:phosphate-selective porin OprO/OprP